MSKYITFGEVVFRDERALIAALNHLGYADVERGKALPLYGYQGDKRAETADIVVRRKHIGSYSNDVGFARDATGALTPVISEYDQSAIRHMVNGERRDLLPAIRTAYGEQVAERVAKRMHGRVTKRVEGGKTKITVTY